MTRESEARNRQSAGPANSPRRSGHCASIINATTPTNAWPTSSIAGSGTLFTYLRDPATDATNWRGEHAMRYAVVNRKVWGGNRTRRGADHQAILMSVLRTLKLRGTDAIGWLAEKLLHRNRFCSLDPPGGRYSITKNDSDHHQPDLRPGRSIDHDREPQTHGHRRVVKTYDYDQTGRRTVETPVGWHGDPPGALTRRIRLINERRAKSGTVQFNITYTYDAAGNRLLADDRGQVTHQHLFRRRPPAEPGVGGGDDAERLRRHGQPDAGADAF